MIFKHDTQSVTKLISTTSWSVMQQRWEVVEKVGSLTEAQWNSAICIGNIGKRPLDVQYLDKSDCTRFKKALSFNKNWVSFNLKPD